MTLLSVRVSRKDDAFTPNKSICHVQKDVGSDDDLGCMNTDAVKFLRPSPTKMLRGSDAQKQGQFFGCRRSPCFFPLWRSE